MKEFIFAPGNFPFTVALFVLIGMAAVEFVSTLMGCGLSQLVENFMPDLDIDVPDLDVPDADVDMPSMDATDVEGMPLFTKFLENKRIEWDNYRIQVTQYELAKYLPVL